MVMVGGWGYDCTSGCVWGFGGFVRVWEDGSGDGAWVGRRAQDYDRAGPPTPAGTLVLPVTAFLTRALDRVWFPLTGHAALPDSGILISAYWHPARGVHRRLEVLAPRPATATRNSNPFPDASPQSKPS